MDEVGKYHAKWNRPSPKNQRTNAFSDKCMTIYNEGRWWGEEKYEGNLDGVEEKGVGVGENGKTVEWNR